MTQHPLACSSSSLSARLRRARDPLATRLRDHPRPLIHRFGARASEGETSGELVRDSRLAVLEAVLFAADEPLTARRLGGLIGVADGAAVRKLIAGLRQLYDADGTAFQIEEVADGFQLLTRPEFHPWLALLRRDAPDLTLSAAARETLTIVAYRQPVTRADLEAIRGVGCSEVLQQLMDRGLIRMAGRDDSLGRPHLYATTRRFLQVFGLRTLRDLPATEGSQKEARSASEGSSEARSASEGTEEEERQGASE
jgi:segregation and condensation protein B